MELRLLSSRNTTVPPGDSDPCCLAFSFNNQVIDTPSCGCHDGSVLALLKILLRLEACLIDEQLYVEEDA